MIYQALHPQGYQYTWFCQQYRAWAAKTEVVMRRTHRAGETLFVDYAGQTVAVMDRATGETRQAQICVAVLGASNYTYVEATWSQGLDDWLMAHVRAFEFFGGVPEIVVPDNLKTGVQQPHRYEPDLHPSYAELAAHYGVAVIPARVRKPRDKDRASYYLLYGGWSDQACRPAVAAASLAFDDRDRFTQGRIQTTLIITIQCLLEQATPAPLMD